MAQIELNIICIFNESDTSFYITFEAQEIIKPVRPIYISDDKANNTKSNTYILEGITFSTQSPKMYYSEESIAYNTLNEIINNPVLWEEKNTTETIQANRYESDDNFNFLKVIRKEYDELVFSNLFAHYFMQNVEVFSRFCSEILGVDNISGNYKIERETQDNIDLLVQDTLSKVKSTKTSVKRSLP